MDWRCGSSGRELIASAKPGIQIPVPAKKKRKKGIFWLQFQRFQLTVLGCGDSGPLVRPSVMAVMAVEHGEQETAHLLADGKQRPRKGVGLSIALKVMLQRVT
jgi:hypothetical protein